MKTPRNKVGWIELAKPSVTFPVTAGWVALHSNQLQLGVRQVNQLTSNSAKDSVFVRRLF